MAEKRKPTRRPFEGHPVRRNHPARIDLPVSGDGERAVSAPWRIEHGAKNG